MPNEFQQKILDAVWNNQDNDLIQLLTAYPEQQADILSMCCDFKKIGKSTILKVAFVRANKTAILQLIRYCRGSVDLLNGLQGFLPEHLFLELERAVSGDFGGGAAAAAASQENANEAKLENAIKQYTFLDNLKRQQKSIISQQIVVKKLRSLEEKVRFFLPKHHEFILSQDNPGKLWEVNKKYFSYCFGLQEHLAQAMLQLYGEAAENISKPVDPKYSLEEIYGGLLQIYHKLKFVQQKFAERSQQFFKLLPPSIKDTCENELLKIFKDELEFIEDKLQALQGGLAPEFVEYLEYTEIRTNENLEVAVIIKNQEYVNNILMLIVGLEQILYYDPIAVKLAAEHHEGIEHLKEQFVNERQEFLEHVDKRNQQILMAQARGEKLNDARGNFYLMYARKQRMILLADQFLMLASSEITVKPTRALERAVAAADVIEENTVAGSVLTSDSPLKSGPTSAFAASDMSAAAAAVEPTPTKDVAIKEGQVLAHIPASARVDSQPSISSSMVVQTKKRTRLICTDAALSAEEFNMLRQSKLQEYSKTIEEQRAQRREHLAAQRLLQRQQILENLTHNHEINDFSKEFELIASTLNVTPELLADVSEFIETPNGVDIYHSELTSLVERLGFKTRRTSSGYMHSFKMYSESYHEGHKHRLGTFAVDPHSISRMRQVMVASKVVPTLQRELIRRRVVLP